MNTDKDNANSPASDEPTEVLPESGPPPVPTTPTVDTSAAPATTADAPAPAEPPARSGSRGWLIAGAAVGGVIVLGLAFGGGIATGFALDGDQRGGPAAAQDGRGLPGGDGDRSGGGHGQQRPEQGTPLHPRGEHSEEDGATPAPTPES